MKITIVKKRSEPVKQSCPWIVEDFVEKKS